MLWEISSGSLDVVIDSSKADLEKNISQAIEAEKPESLGTLVFMRKLTGWHDSTTKEELEGQDSFMTTEHLLKRFGKWED